MNEPKHVLHPFPPLYDENSRVLILGSFPSVKSREQKFFYGHPQNRFWRVLAAVFASETPQTVAEKRRFLLSHGIALWDVIASCEITGSADSSKTRSRTTYRRSSRQQISGRSLSMGRPRKNIIGSTRKRQPGVRPSVCHPLHPLTQHGVWKG